MEADEGVAVIAFGQAEMRLVERDDLEAGGAYLIDDLLEKVRGDLQDAVRLEAVGLLRPHMMQHEDGADAARQRRDHAVRTRIMQGGERGPEESRATAHDGVTWPPMRRAGLTSANRAASADPRRHDPAFRAHSG